MDIIIKNVTGAPENEWLIWELSRAGFGEGAVVRGVKYSPGNNSCSWSSGINHCVAWLGETCEEVKSIHKSSKQVESVRLGCMNQLKKEKVYILFQTDVYKSKASRVCFGIYSSKEKAVDTAKENNLCSYLSEVEVIECEIDWFEEI